MLDDGGTRPTTASLPAADRRTFLPRRRQPIRLRNHHRLIDLDYHLLVVLLHHPPPEHGPAVANRAAAVARGADHPAGRGVSESNHHPHVGVPQPDEQVLGRADLVQELQLRLYLDPPRPASAFSAELRPPHPVPGCGGGTVDPAVTLPPPVALHLPECGDRDAFHWKRDLVGLFS
ncbi:hypothetical protein LINGRAHAP2_LOCUS15964 [Linum grandiflorum]